MRIKKTVLVLFSLVFLFSLVTLVGSEEIRADEPIRIDIVVGFAAGGSNDLTARYMAQYLTDYGITANIINMPGGMSTEAAYYVSQEVGPDENVFFWGHSGPLLFEPAADYRGYTIEDFDPVATLAAPTFAIGARPGAPWGDDFEALVQYIKDNPGDVAFGGQGEGNVRHYAVEQILPPDELDYVFVGMEGGAAVAMNLTGEHVDVGHLSLAAASPLVKDGELWAVVNTNPLQNRDPLMPDVPNVAEFGIPEGREPHPIALWAVKGTDPALIERIANAMEQAAQNPELQEQYAGMGVVLHFMGPEETLEFYMDVNENVVPHYLEWLEAYLDN